MSKYITSQELATHLGLRVEHLNRLAKSGQIPYYIIGKRRRFILEEVEEHIQANNRIMTSSEARAKAYGRV